MFYDNNQQIVTLVLNLSKQLDTIEISSNNNCPILVEYQNGTEVLQIVSINKII